MSRAAESQRDDRLRDEAWWVGLGGRLRESPAGHSYRDIAIRTGYKGETVRR